MKKYSDIFVLSVAILFLELLVIRWIGTEINIFAYLQNSVLVVCFLGLGMGCILSKREEHLESVLLPLALLLAVMAIPQGQQFFSSISHFLSWFHDFTVWAIYEGPGDLIGQASVISAAVFGTVAIAALIWRSMFVLGVFLGRAFEAAPRGLTAYSFNIAGSLLGVWLFAVLSWFSAAPWLWFLTFAILSIPLIKKYSRRIMPASLSVILLIALAALIDWNSPALETRWSPYQKIALEKYAPPGQDYLLRVNNVGYQALQDLRPEAIALQREQFPLEQQNLSQYDIPGRLNRQAKKALIVGAGTGNDVAGLLRNSTAEITAVEIDPVILDMGRRFHPEKPYDSPRVHPVANDARSFFQETREKFDLIVFGLLDSHTTPVLTNARLDHFVYTTESLQTAYGLLAPGGVMAVIFQVQRPYIFDRMYQELAAASGQEPMAFKVDGSPYGWGGTFFVVGDQQTLSGSLSQQSDLAAFIEKNHLDKSGRSVISITDDWPYLYIEKPTIPSLFYVLGFMLVLLWFFTSRHVGLSAISLRVPSSTTIHFFALGAAFSLLEMFGLSRLAILFGSTWFVNTGVISGVLLMILCANTIAALPRPPRSYLVYCGLMGCCLAMYFYDFAGLSQHSIFPRAVISGILVSLPMLFSGILFGRSFDRATNKSEALGANLLGALLGGILQFLSFLIGIRALLLIVASLYLLAIVTDPVRKRAEAVR